jgi:hypothetical protein
MEKAKWHSISRYRGSFVRIIRIERPKVLDRPGAIDAALDFEPERSGGWQAPTCLVREE